MKRVLITGSSGMLGCDLSRELRKSYEVFGADILARRSSFVVRSLKADITDAGSVAEVIKKTRSDIVIHAAAWTDVDACELEPKKAYRINSTGTKNVALACKKFGVPLIYISTDFVFSGNKKTPYKESDKPYPLGVYADSKLQGEKAVENILKSYFIVRTSWLYGRCGKNFVDTIIAKAERERSIKVVDDQVGSPTCAKDLSAAIHKLLDRFFTGYGLRVTGYGTYHVSNSGAVSWYDYARTILRITRLKTKVIPISSKELARPAKRPVMSVMDCSKFEKFTGFKMRNWKIALKDYLVNCHCEER
ncbi:MAG TPA: dTDP-4-dehydrorhamnose reductase [Candidatus Omnitrophota bacterium]|nr:dTDP-4-dehydrorhamnose reductase [Candidatus Omnitrophota bacterium]